MSTNNQPKQTLFRFVSLRAPQKSDDQGQNKRFVLAPDTLKTAEGFYKHVIDSAGNGTKQELLSQYASTFEGSAFDKDTPIINSFPTELYDFALWLAKSKTSYSDAELVSKAQNALSAFDLQDNINKTKILSIWNNLIYQVTTQKDFYIKETLMQLLLAIHVLQHLGTDEENKVLLNARVVLPKDLILDDDSVTNSPTSTTRPSLYNSTFATEEMQKQQKFASANMTLSRLDLLKKDLSKVQKKYNKAYEAAYQTQEDAYQQEVVRPIMDQYNADVAAAKSAYCETRDPNVEYNPEDPCNQPAEVPIPEIPKFEFNFRDEVEATEIINALPENSLETLLELVEYDIPMNFNAKEISEEQLAAIQGAMADFTTFKEVEDLVSAKKEEAQKLLLNNTLSNEKTFKSVGGVMIPVARAGIVTNYFTICPKQNGRWTSFDLAIYLPDLSWDVAGISYTISESVYNSSYSGNNFVKTKSGSIVYLNNLFVSTTTNGVMLFDAPHTMNIQVTFANGKTTQIVANFDNNLEFCDRGTFEIDGFVPGENGEEGSFIPSGFGFKNIGIADYLKVEQSTHAYVPGEVAHIENIMAREYRQKSTRRLRRSENTSTTSSDIEREKLTDTTTATRFEMQSEIAKIMQEAKDTNVQAHFNTDGSLFGKVNFNAGIAGGYATHSSKEESTRQAMTQSQDITERALDRIVTKVHEERIEKVIEEFEENNAHGFDNREGDKNVVGVFRWVDKLMKNQIFNYGKRMMFEFMIPEPAKLHDLGMKVQKSASDVELKEPEDPRRAVSLAMEDYTALENEAILNKWISKYNVELESFTKKINISHPISFTTPEDYNSGSEFDDVAHGNFEVEIPYGYSTTGNAKIEAAIISHPTKDPGFGAYICVGNIRHDMDYKSDQSFKNSFTKNISDLNKYSNKIGISYCSEGFHAGNINVNIECELNKEGYQMIFKKIIEAYKEALVEFNNKVSEQQSKAVEIKGSNPAFYRQIENTVLRKNCISYMIDRTANSTHGYGMSGLTQGSSFMDYETVLSPTLDKYTAFVKFIEQAFEWENLSYYLYPYYWGNKSNWSDLYQSEDIDPLFRSFIQSGMARVIVTVRPGFEDAVQFYMATGKIWNGGETPIIGDELYMSIVDEMKESKGEEQGKAWITRLPTPLTILQAQNIGLTVDHALPFTEENPNDFEVPSEVVTESAFTPETNLLEGTSPTSKVIGGDWS